MTIKPELIALMVILLFVTVFLLVIRTNKKMSAEKTHQSTTLGFQAVTSSPTNLLARAENLFQRNDKQSIFIDNVFSRKELDQELYIFDIHNSQSEDSEMGSEVFGVISSELALPRFSMTTLPGFDRDSLMGSLMDKLLDKVLSMAEKYQGMTRIEFPDNSDFGEAVIVFGEDQAAVRDLLQGIHIRSITDKSSPLHIAGIGDFLTVDFSMTSTMNNSERDLISQYQQFSQIKRSFM